MAVAVNSRGAALAGTATATVVILACGIVTGLIAARSLGPDGRGQLTAITVWASTLLYAATLGLPEAVAYFSAANPADRARVWITGQTVAALLGLGVTTLGWWIIPFVLTGPKASLVASVRLYLVLFAVPCLGSLCACAWLQGVGATKQFNVSRSMVHIVNAAGTLVLFGVGSHAVTAFATVLLVGNAATWILASSFGPFGSPLPAPSRSLAGGMLHYGLRVQFGSWSNAANVKLDQLLLSVMAPAASLGLYVVAVSYAGLLMTVPGSAALVMLPDVVRAHGEGASRACVAQWYRRILWTTVAGAVAIGLVAGWLIPAVFGGAFSEAVPVALILLPAIAILGMNQILSAAFRGVGRPEVGSQAEVVGLVVTAGALALLLPNYGIYGAALASLMAYASSHLYLARRVISILGADLRSLCVLRREDIDALRAACFAGLHWLTGHPTGGRAGTSEF